MQTCFRSALATRTSCLRDSHQSPASLRPRRRPMLIEKQTNEAKIKVLTIFFCYTNAATTGKIKTQQRKGAIFPPKCPNWMQSVNTCHPTQCCDICHILLSLPTAVTLVHRFWSVMHVLHQGNRAIPCSRVGAAQANTQTVGEV